MKYTINKFGFEIEGEFSEAFSRSMSGHGSIKGDGSVHTCADLDYQEGRRADEAWHTGHPHARLGSSEFASDPFDYSREGLDRADDVLDMFSQAWESGGYHNNDSAGFHVHVSFREFGKRGRSGRCHPPEIISAEFHQLFMDALKKRYPSEWEARKDNRYCKPVIDEKDIASFGGERYRMINLTNLRGSLDTVEFRFFPSAHPYKMLEYLHFILDFTKHFLYKHSISSRHELEIDGIVQEAEIGYDEQESYALECDIGAQITAEALQSSVEETVAR